MIILCEKIRTYGNAGNWTALLLLSMYCYNSDDKWILNKESFISIIENTNMTIDGENTSSMDNFHWSDAVIRILTNSNEMEFAIIITKHIVEYCSLGRFNYSFDIYIGNAILVLLDKYFEPTWNYFGEGLLGDFTTFSNLEQKIGAKNGNLDSSEGIAFKNPDYYHIIFDWCRKHSDFALERITQMMPLSIVENNEINWHPFSKAFIDEFGDNEKVLIQLSSNMGTFGTIGPRISYFSKQKKLLEELVNHKIQRVNEWAIGMLEYIEKVIKRETLIEEEYLSDNEL